MEKAFFLKKDNQASCLKAAVFTKRTIDIDDVLFVTTQVLSIKLRDDIVTCVHNYSREQKGKKYTMHELRAPGALTEVRLRSNNVLLELGFLFLPSGGQNNILQHQFPDGVIKAYMKAIVVLTSPVSLYRQNVSTHFLNGAFFFP